MNNIQIQEMQRIIEKYIPLGNENSLCHVGICSIKRCARCQDAQLIRELFDELKLIGHIGK